ncbi:unnamed protein product [Psylliodes chrysocephalus]|uniref:Uncharacterized protein n=1 Tax=Psylliodes chrysocephalus TaxID=3402493 RepID=A0A9P0GJ24_9CUCU|nr:unnamed protein product [Psylliodes chrysocephala]
MDELDYYKSLVSDDEVVNALIRDSKAREGLLEKPRVRPNLQFFQRTVNNLVSSNKRVTEKQEYVKAIEKEKNKVYRPKKVLVRKKLPIEYIREILTNRIEFVKPSEEENADKTTQSCDAKEIQTSAIPHSSSQKSRQRSFNQTKSPFQQIREILSKNIGNNSSSSLSSNSSFNQRICTKTQQTQEDMDTSCSSESEDLSIRKINDVSDTIITLSDSDTSDSGKSVEIVDNVASISFNSVKITKK